MTVPAPIAAEVLALATAVSAASPLASANRILVTSLQLQGAIVLNDVQNGLETAAGALDAPDPGDFPGQLVVDLLGLSTATDDQTSLCDLRGLVGRAMFNLAQAGV